VLVLRPGALGDTLLAVPALRALRSVCSPLRLAAHAGAARLLQSVNEVDAGMGFDDPSLGWLFRTGEPPAGEAVVAWMNPRGAPRLGNALVVAPGRPGREDIHCAQYLLNTLAPLDVDPQLDDRPLEVRAHRTDDVLVHPGSGSTMKNWPAARFAATIALFDRPVQLIVGEADEQAARDVEACLGMSLPRLAHVPLEQLAQRLAGCRAFLGNDSGVSHLAGLCGAATVVLFGPTSPTVWRPLGPSVHVLPFETDVERVVALLQR
jgi:heptosyltransferase III